MDYEVIKQELKDNDIVIIKIKSWAIDYMYAQEIFNEAHEIFPDHNIILIPPKTDLKFKTWLQLYDYIISIKPEGETK